MRFTKSRRGITARPDEVEVQVLQHVVGELLVLLGEDAEPSDDPLEALLGLSAEGAELPTDPAVARLLPDAYGSDDQDSSREFRRYTEGDLRAGKRAHATAVLASLAARPGEPLLLDREQADAWLGCLNDLRLVLGTRLEVDDADEEEPDEDDPRGPALQLYHWLGMLQDSLLSCLMRR